MSFLVKICGLTRPTDAELICRAGADAVGLNFWRGSKRFVEDGQASEILAAVAPGMLKAQDRMLAPLSPAERSEFMRMLRLLVEANNELSRAPSSAA